ncbi:hypothetical protein V8F06_014701 [Rhypophila decipiens]
MSLRSHRVILTRADHRMFSLFVMPAGLLQFLSINNDEEDSFRYRKSRDVLVRYSLVQPVEGQWLSSDNA